MDPGNAFRLVVKVSPWLAKDAYGRVEMSEQKLEPWLDRSQHYSLDKFHEDMTNKIIWGGMQKLPACVIEKIVLLHGKLEGMNIFSGLFWIDGMKG
jgi:hypothetical protein